MLRRVKLILAQAHICGISFVVRLKSAGFISLFQKFKHFCVVFSVIVPCGINIKVRQKFVNHVYGGNNKHAETEQKIIFKRKYY